MNQEFARTRGILDVVTMANRHDTILVLPTLDHAFWWWRIVRTAVTEAHGKECVTHTKTAVVTKCNHRALRLWVPYEPEPTMPMDNPGFRYYSDFVSPYYTTRELRRLA